MTPYEENNKRIQDLMREFMALHKEQNPLGSFGIRFVTIYNENGEAKKLSEMEYCEYKLKK